VRPQPASVAVDGSGAVSRDGGAEVLVDFTRFRCHEGDVGIGATGCVRGQIEYGTSSVCGAGHACVVGKAVPVCLIHELVQILDSKRLAE
jgi:hypothetical protein